MINLKRVLFLSFLIVLLIQTLLWAAYDPHKRLLIKNLNFCETKPKGMGRFDPIGEKGFEIGGDVYLYMEVDNCKSVRDVELYQASLIMDMDIYYEDGTCVYSQKEVKSFSPESPREFSDTFIWIKIDTRYLKPGEYKVEVNVRDESSGKEGFAIERLKVY